MNLNFNIVKKPDDKDEEELEEIEELTDNYQDVEVDIKKVADDDDDDDMPSYDPKKRMFRFMGIIVFVMIMLIMILFLISSCSNRGRSSNYSYSKIETVLTNAAKSYFKDHPEYLPQDNGDVVEVESSTLVAEGKMKELSEYTDKNCSASVQVESEGSKNYLYTPFLNCGDDYSTIPLYSKVIDNNEPVTTGYGLYANNGGYAFRGEEVNNYVQLDNSLWRIVKITADNNVVLINADGLDYSETWDDRYNEKSGFQTGINNYGSSRVKELLDKIYSGDVEYDEYLVLSKKDKARIVPYNLCVGKRKITSETKNNSEECTQLLKDQKLGLLTLSDYIYASIDPNCKSASTGSCQNYNYLVIRDEWWLMTANATDTTTAYMVNRSGVVKAEEAYGYATIRPVIYLNENVLFKSGKGTFKKPYKVK